MNQRWTAMALALFGAFALTACDDGIGNDSLGLTDRSESYSYEYTHNGCHTGKHSFKSKRALCEGLRNDSLNRNCALALREEAFKSYRCTEFGLTI